MSQSYHLTLTEDGDLRELIPEVITLPEMYVNNIKANFGATQEGIVVDNINLPPWANGDPYYFTFKMRELFESQAVNENIHHWFDLIFGQKQRGEPAIDAINVYLPITYEDGIDLTDPENLSIKDSLMNQAYNFGQCPSQLFTDLHGGKIARKGPPIFLDPIASLNSKTFDYNKKKYGIITDIKFTSHDELIMFGNKKILMGMTYNQAVEGSKKEILTERSNFKKEKYDFDDSRIYLTEDTPIKLMVKQDLQMVFGGFWDGKIFVQSFTKKPTIILKHHLFRVTMIEVSESEEIIITGTEKGDIVKWNRHDGKITYEKSFFHHLNAVTGAFISEDMGVFATCSKDSTVNLYTISPPYLLRSFRQPRCFSLSRVLISEAPLASVIMLSSDFKYLDVFSINGKHLKSYEDQTEILNPMIAVDESFQENLVYGTTAGKLIISKLPYLEPQNIVPCLDKQSVTPLCVTPDKRVLIYYHLGLCCIGDFFTNLPPEGNEFKKIIGFINRK